jgi:CHAT domain-containing protein/tetratricopeptide (TPR) repeat protein
MKILSASLLIAQLLSAQNTPSLDTLKNEVVRLAGEAKYGEAGLVQDQVLEQTRKTAGPNSLATAGALNDRAYLYQMEGSMKKAEPLYLQSLSITEKVRGPQHPDTAGVLNNLGTFYCATEQLSKAEPLLVRALAIREKVLPPEDPDVAISLDNLASLYQSKGAYKRAEALYLRALAIKEEVKGPKDPDTAYSLNNLGFLYNSAGSYDKAEPLFVRALDIREKNPGPNHPDTAFSLDNLGNLKLSKGDYTAAEPLFQRALDIRRKALPPNHPDTGTSLNNLAYLYQVEGAYAKSELLYKEALQMTEKSEQPNPGDLAAVVDNLAGIYQLEKNFKESELQYLRALRIREQAFGPKNLLVAVSLNNLGVMYKSQRDYAKAEPFYVRALSIAEKTLGREHPEVATGLNNLAALYESRGEYAKAELLYNRALEIRKKILGVNHPETLISRQHLILLHCAEGAWTKASVEFSDLLANPRDRRDIAFGRDTEQKNVIDVRESLLSALHAGALIPTQRKVYLPLLLKAALFGKARLTEERRAVIDALQEHAAPEDRQLLQQLEDTWTSISALAQKGPNGLGLDEYSKEIRDLEIQESDLTAKMATRSAEFRKQTEDPTLSKVANLLEGRILIEILRVARFHPAPGKFFGDPVYIAIALFPDGRVDMVELGLAKPIDDWAVMYFTVQQSPDNASRADSVAQKLGDAIIAPIAQMAGSITEWDLSPDGNIRLLPLNALRLNGKYLVETHKVWPRGSGRDLLTADANTPSTGVNLILPNPDFGNGERFVRLTDSEAEAESIADVLHNASIVDPADRTKSFLLSLTAPPRILHLATHGFYHSGDGDPAFRSGIALNGANAGPDGILIAREAQRLFLRGTQLVVVSACETGQGQVSFGEGVIGLQRSFTLAGARTQMLTQWSVNSDHTSDFMTRFYTKLASGKKKGEAWIETQRELIHEGVAPYFWAPFVLYGDPGPITLR